MTGSCERALSGESGRGTREARGGPAGPCPAGERLTAAEEELERLRTATLPKEEPKIARVIPRIAEGFGYRRPILPRTLKFNGLEENLYMIMLGRTCVASDPGSLALSKSLWTISLHSQPQSAAA
jgi:hypothetical protein